MEFSPDFFYFGPYYSRPFRSKMIVARLLMLLMLMALMKLLMLLALTKKPNRLNLST